MDIYLIEDMGKVLVFPVNPKEINIKRSKLYETINIISLGEVDFTHGEKIKEISFSSFFPADCDKSYCNYSEIPDPQVAMDQLTDWMVSETPVRLIISGTLVNVLGLVAVHNSTFKGGEPGDVYFDLTIRSSDRTWREIRVRTQAEAASTTNTTVRPDNKKVNGTYTVKSGDCLWAIAQLQLGDGSRWSEIYNLNKDTIGNKPELIQVGMELVMPT